jgi:hypothetical protein
LTRVKRFGRILGVTEGFRQPTAESLLEALRAEERLARMALVEDMGVLADTEASPRLRRKFAAQYRRVIGVNPERRRELRIALEGVKAGGGRPVADVIDSINREDHANGSV